MTILRCVRQIFEMLNVTSYTPSEQVNFSCKENLNHEPFVADL